MQDKITIANAPECLNTNDQAMWVLGYQAAIEARSPCLLQIQEPTTKTEALAHYSQQAILAMDEAAPAAMEVPYRWKLVPDADNMTDEQAEAIAELARVCGGGALDIYRAALTAAPTANAVKSNLVESHQIKEAAQIAPVQLPEPVMFAIDRFDAYFRSANAVTPNARISVPTSEWQALRALLAGVSAPAAKWLQQKDLEALERFEETASDNQGHDIGKAAVSRLAGFGCLQSHGFGVYSITDFGHFVMDDWEHARSLPFKAQDERDAEHRAAQAAAQGGE